MKVSGSSLKAPTAKLIAFASVLFTLSITPVLAITGATLLTYGTYLIYHPAGYIVGGLILILAAIDSSS